MIRARQLAGAGIGLGAVTIWSALLGLITTPILIHRLGVSEYGVFALISVISAYVLNLEFGFGHATIRFLAQARARHSIEDEAAVIGSSLLIFLPMAIIGVAVVLLGAPFIVRHFAHGPPAQYDTYLNAVRLGSLIVGLSFIAAFATAALQAVGQFAVVLLTRAIFGTLLSAAAVAVAIGGGGLTGVLIALVGITTAMCVTFLVALAKASNVPLRPRLYPSTFRKMARFGFFVLLAGIGTQIMLQGPTTVLAHYATTAEIAVFSVPNLVVQQLVGLVGATSLGFLPFVSGASVNSDRTHIGDVYRSNLRLTVLIMGPISVYLGIFARTLLATWIDPSFASQAQAPLRWLAGAIVVLGVSAPPADVARGLGRPALVSVYSTASAVTTVGLAFVAVPAHGATGTAFALAVGLAVTTVPFVFLIARRLLGLGVLDLMRSLAGPVLALTVAAAIYESGAALSGQFFVAVIAGLVGTLVYAAIAYKLVLGQRERDVFVSLWREIRARAQGRRTTIPSPVEEGGS